MWVCCAYQLPFFHSSIMYTVHNMSLTIEFQGPESKTDVNSRYTSVPFTELLIVYYVRSTLLMHLPHNIMAGTNMYG